MFTKTSKFKYNVLELNYVYHQILRIEPSICFISYFVNFRTLVVFMKVRLVYSFFYLLYKYITSCYEVSHILIFKFIENYFALYCQCCKLFSLILYILKHYFHKNFLYVLPYKTKLSYENCSMQ